MCTLYCAQLLHIIMCRSCAQCSANYRHENFHSYPPDNAPICLFEGRGELTITPVTSNWKKNCNSESHNSFIHYQHKLLLPVCDHPQQTYAVCTATETTLCRRSQLQHSQNWQLNNNFVFIACYALPSVPPQCWLGVRKSIRPVKS